MKTITTKQIAVALFSLIILPTFSQIEAEKVWATFKTVPNVERNPDGKLVSADIELQSFISKHNIINIEQALPASRKEELLQVYEIECECDAIDLMVDITQSKIGISKPEIAPKYELLYDPNDYNVVFQPDYALDLINAKEAWNYSIGDSSTLIGISDANYHLANVDLANKYLSFSSPNTNPNYEHGTAVATTAAGDTDNAAGKSSIGFNCMMHLRSMSYNNVLDLSYKGCRIINCSWSSGCTYSSYVQSVIDEAYENRTIIVCAAGNGSTCGGPTNLVYPAANQRTISVSSVGPYDNHERVIGDPATTHQHNSSVDLCAPGYDIAAGTTWTFGPSLINGTSFAAPYVTGTIGLILSIRPCLTYEEVLEILQSTATYIDSINPNYAGSLGAGRLDAGAALKYAYEEFECPALGIYIDSSGSEEQFDDELLADITNTYLEQIGITVYPNPNNGTFILEVITDTEEKIDEISIFDVTGRKVITKKSIQLVAGKNTLDYDLTTLAKGHYMLQLLQGENQITKKVMVN